MAMASIDASMLEAFEKDLLKALHEHPREAKKFMNKMGSALRKVSKKNYQTRTKKKTGNLLRGLKKGKAYLYRPQNAFSVRVYNVAPHSHLIELGHESGYAGGKFVKGKYILENSIKQFSTEFESSAGSYVDKFLKKGFK